MEYKIIKSGEGSVNDIENFIKTMDAFFIPPLGDRVDILEYSIKLRNHATKFIYKEGEEIIAMCVAYINEAPKESFGTYLGVLPAYNDLGLGLDLTMRAIKFAEKTGSASFRVKVRASNKMLLKFYYKMGFEKTLEEFYPNSDILEYELVKQFK